MQDTLLNLIPGACSPEVHLSQYDKGRVVPFKLADGKSAYNVPAGSAIVVKATKPSGLGFIVPVSFEGDTATMTITETMSNEYGRFPAELSITNGGTLIGTANFVLNVEKSPHPEGTTDGDAETLIPELTLLVNEIRESNAKVESMTASASPLPTGSNPTAEYDAENNNLAFGIPTPEVTTEDLYKAFITKSASGEIASFSDGGDDLPMKSLLVNIVPKQSGSGDPSPSNVRPISGYSEVKVDRVGKNLLDPTYRYNQSDTSNYHIRYYWAGAGEEYHTQLLVKKGVTYTFSYDGAVASSIYVKKGTSAQDQTNVFITYNKNFITFTPTEDFYCAIDVYWASEPTGGIASINPILSVGSTVTAYEPYNGTTYTTSLGQTVYGGTLEVMSGKLTITKGYSYFDGTENWYSVNIVDSNKNRAMYALLKPATGSYDTNLIGNYISAPTIAQGNPDLWKANFNGSGDLVIGIPTSITTVAQWKTYLSSNPLQVVYNLAPTEITLTPTQVKTLLGNNNIWSESGTEEVEYRADTTLAYNELVAMILENIGG